MPLSSNGHAPKRLFHVEDSIEMRKRITGELDKIAGIEVVGSSDRAGDAIEKIRLIQPDLVVLDLQLAEGNGIDVLREFGAAAEPPLIIVLTNHSDSRFRELSLRAGADHFFDKSTQFEEFIILLNGMTR